MVPMLSQLLILISIHLHIGTVTAGYLQEELVTTLHINGSERHRTAQEYWQSIDNHTCRVTVDRYSALYLKGIFGAYHPNFARIRLQFNKSEGQIISHTSGVIQPFHWIWTYYSLEGLFSYLKWPTDFSMLSFGLLDSKTLPPSADKSRYLQLNVQEGNCSLTIGTKSSDHAIAQALKEFTRDYLLKAHPQESYDVSYSYWCYLAEVPGVRNTVGYQMSLYLEYPVEFAKYNCCYTQQHPENTSDLQVNWKQYLISKMLVSAFVPYIMSLVAFAYFPILLMSIGHDVVSVRLTAEKISELEEVDEDESTEEEEDNDDFIQSYDIVYLNGTPPISVTILVGQLCGLVDKYPVAVSRFFRFLFVILSPCVLWIRIYAYKHNKIASQITKALLDHDSPMGYLSMIGGFDKSRQLFVPIFGGPIIVLLAFHFLGLLFVILPNDINDIIERGCKRNSRYNFMSPLVFDLRNLEIFSSVCITSKYGYARAKSVCLAGVYMLFSPKFWWSYLRLQCRRSCSVFTSFSPKCYSMVSYFIMFLLTPILLMIALVEICLILLLYGIPLINFMCIIVRGYLMTLHRLMDYSDNGRHFVIDKILNRVLLKIIVTILLSVCFVYYVFSFCTIFTTTFIFLSKLLMFSFIAVIVYPSSSFGYLFFGIVLIYYVFKMFQSFGDGYFELLADAVEVSSQLDEDPFRTHIVDGTVIIERTSGCTINKLQIHDRIINLSTDQQQAVRDACRTHRLRLVYKNYAAGIPRDLFTLLVDKYRPIHIQLAQALWKLCLIAALIWVTIRITVVKPGGSTEGVSEVMHVVFIMAMGALPKILEVALDNMNHSVKKDIQLREMKIVIMKYWNDVFLCQSVSGLQPMV